MSRSHPARGQGRGSSGSSNLTKAGLQSFRLAFLPWQPQHRGAMAERYGVSKTGFSSNLPDWELGGQG